MEPLTWTSEISWCTEHISPLKMYKHITDWAARPCPHPVSPTHGRPRPTQIEEPLPCTDSEAENSRGGTADLFPAGLNLLQESLEMSQSAQPHSPQCDLLWASWWWWVGGTDPRGQRWVGSHVLMNVFLSLDIGHFTISSQKNQLHWFSFFFFLSNFVPLQEFHRSKVAANKLHVMFGMVDGAQTGFAFFAVTFEDLCNHSCRGPTATGVFPLRENVEWRPGWEFELEKHCREWFLSGRLVCMTRLM